MGDLPGKSTNWHGCWASLLVGSSQMVSDRNRRRLSIISALQAKRMMRKGCMAFLAAVVITKKEVKVEDIHVVSEYADVFPEDLPGIPPEREVDFTIELVPGAAPVSRAQYRMSPA